MVKNEIINKSTDLGFSQCGFAPCEPLENLRSFYNDFVLKKRFGALQYLERYAEPRLNPELLLPGAKTVICVTMNYHQPEQIPCNDNFFIAKYAYGYDYHRLIRERMDCLVDFMRSTFGDIIARAFVDSGNVLEKAWAQQCGIGWQGKNTLVINKSRGSFFFIGIILTDLVIKPDHPEANHCGECEQCVKACPTKALDTPYQLNIPRCISYLTIENRMEIQDDLKDKLNDRIYGCDICQDVCPYNRLPVTNTIPEFLPSAWLMTMRKKDWISLTEQQFDQYFTRSPLKRLGYQGLMKNIHANHPSQR